MQNGDGCSNTCQIEPGFTCEGTKCWEIIQPSAIVSHVSEDNLVTIKFSEPAVVTSYKDLVANLQATIYGPAIPYKFEHELVSPSNQKEASGELTYLKVQVKNIKTNINGHGIETVAFTLGDYSVIKDLNGNSLIKGGIRGYLSKTEYISESKSF